MTLRFLAAGLTFLQSGEWKNIFRAVLVWRKYLTACYICYSKLLKNRFVSDCRYRQQQEKRNPKVFLLWSFHQFRKYRLRKFGVSILLGDNLRSHGESFCSGRRIPSTWSEYSHCLARSLRASRHRETIVMNDSEYQSILDIFKAAHMISQIDQTAGRSHFVKIA